eukprot:6210255-Pleurochrysis_carterae.AAC.3
MIVSPSSAGLRGAAMHQLRVGQQSQKWKNTDCLSALRNGPQLQGTVDETMWRVLQRKVQALLAIASRLELSLKSTLMLCVSLSYFTWKASSQRHCRVVNYASVRPGQSSLFAFLFIRNSDVRPFWPSSCAGLLAARAYARCKRCHTTLCTV